MTRGTVAGGLVHYWQTGKKDGPALLFLHGNGADHTEFSRQVDAFSADYRLLFMDSRGHGASADVQPLTLAAMAQDAVQVLDAAGVKRAAVIGFSDGGNIALHMGIRFPGRVAALVLAGANLHPSGVKRSTQWPIDIAYGLTALFAPFSQKARHNHQILGLMIKEPRFTDLQLRGITAPTLVLAGDRDLIKEKHTRKIAGLIPGVALRFVTDCGHFVFAKQPGQTNALIAEFLEEQRRVNAW